MPLHRARLKTRVHPPINLRMNNSVFSLRRIALVMLWLHAFGYVVAEDDLTGDGWPDLLWRHKGSSSTPLWKVTWCAYRDKIDLPATGTNYDWRIIGTGEFGASATNSTPDGHSDILWFHPPTRTLAVWFMNTTTLMSGASISTLVNTNWRVVGVGDFAGSTNGQAVNVRDGKADIVFQHNSTDVKALWIMNGLTYITSILFDDTSPGWSIAAVGDFGASPTNPIQDNKPDLVYVHSITNDQQLLAIQYMDGYTRTVRTNVMNMNSTIFYFRDDLDPRVVGAGLYTTNPGTSGVMDILVRHHTDGRHWAYQLKTNILHTTYPIVPHVYDTDYRRTSQEYTDSIWRITNTSVAFLYGTANSAATQINLTISDLPLQSGWSYTIQRRTSKTYQWHFHGLRKHRFRFDFNQLYRPICYSWSNLRLQGLHRE